MSNNDSNIRNVLLGQCQKFFPKFTVNSAVDCPTHSNYKWACVDSIGKDLLNNEPLVASRQPDQARIALSKSTQERWNRISLESCTLHR